MAVEAREGHACLRLLEEDPEAGLGVALARFGAPSLTDVADEGQQLVALGCHAMDGDLDLDPSPRFGDDARGVSRRCIAAGQPFREVGGKPFTILRGRQVDHRRHRTQLLARVTGEVHVGVVAGDEPAVLRDHQAFAQVA